MLTQLVLLICLVTCVADVTLLPANGNLKSPVKVLLFTYYRGGSTFLGEILNRVKDAFYLYEPIAPIYSHIFGGNGNAVSYFYENGTERRVTFRNIHKH